MIDSIFGGTIARSTKFATTTTTAAAAAAAAAANIFVFRFRIAHQNSIVFNKQGNPKWLNLYK
jgi:hypothetical protein